MDYVVIKSINNNVVLAKGKKTNEQVVLMSKGIGFNRKANDIVSDIGKENQVFILWDNQNKFKNVKCDNEKLKIAIKKIAEIAYKKLGIDEDKIIKSLYDHILFLVDRINFGLYIDNPFENEISFLYAREYEIAKEAVNLINECISIKIGDSEAAFIALHLNSASQKQPISTTMEQVHVYNEISNIIITKFNIKKENLKDVKIFLMSLNRLISEIEKGKMFKIACYDEIKNSMKESYDLVFNIVNIIKKEFNIPIDKTAQAFLTVELEKLKQLN